MAEEILAGGDPTFSERLTGLLADPNFQNLLAGIGTKLDPEGVGGALGTPTTALIKSLAAQKALGKSENKRDAYNKQLLDVLSGMTPKGTPGLSSATVSPGGIKLDIETGDVGGELGGGFIAPTSPRTTAPAQNTTPIAPTSANPSASRRTRLSDLFPF